MLWRRFCAAAGLLFAIELAGADARADRLGLRGLVPFEQVRSKLSQAKAATVTAACGSVAAPWAYRGPRGDSLALKAYARAEEDRSWARDLAGALMVEADWDSIEAFGGRSKLCREAQSVPLFVVRWHTGGDDIYALLSIESRCAVLFKVNQPLGTIWFRNRADTVFASIRRALAADSLIAAMPTPLEIVPSAGDGYSLGELVYLEKLPETIAQVSPEYPIQAQEHGWHGTVLILAKVGKDGLIHDAFVMKSVHGLDDAAVACVWDWKFKPAESGGKPISVWVGIPVKFTLK